MSSVLGPNDPIPPDWMDIWPEPTPGRPHWDLTIETRGIGGPETRRSRKKRRLANGRPLVPLLGYADPNPMPHFRLFRR